MQFVTRLDNFDGYLIGWLKAWSWYMPARFNYLSERLFPERLAISGQTSMLGYANLNQGADPGWVRP